MRNNILQSIFTDSSDTELWWDSSPLLLEDWIKDAIKKSSISKNKKLTEFLNKLYLSDDPKSQVIKGVTNNPILTLQAIKANYEKWNKVVSRIKKENILQGQESVFWELYKIINKEGAELFMPLYEATAGRYGHVSVQLDIRDIDNVSIMVEKAQEIANLSPNIMVKVPGSIAGYKVLERLTSIGISSNSTLNFTHSQIAFAANSVKSGIKQAKSNNVDIKKWRNVITLMEGRFGYTCNLAEKAKDSGVILKESEVRLAELAIFKKSYTFLSKNNFPSKLLSCSIKNGPYIGDKQYCWHLDHKRNSNAVITCPPNLLNTCLDEKNKVVADTSIDIDTEISSQLMDKLLRVPYFNLGYQSEKIDNKSIRSLDVFEMTFTQHLNAVKEMIKIVN